MFVVNFPQSAGGPRQFKNIDKLADFLATQSAEWDSSIFATINFENIDRVRTAWRSVLGHLNNLRQSHPDEEAVVEQFNSLIKNHHLYLVDSPQIEIVKNTYDESGTRAASASLNYLFLSNNQHIFPNVLKDQFIGYMNQWLTGTGVTNKTVEQNRRSLSRLLAKVEAQSEDHRKELDNTLEIMADQYKDQIAASKDQFRWFSRAKRVASQRIKLDRDKWQRSWDELYKLYIEHMRLEAAVSLWEGRADAHEKDAARHSKWAAGIGVVGLLLAGAVAAASLGLAHALFSRAFTVSDTFKPADGLRPTWHFELLFTAGGTILYLTVYLWLMRIIVRMYMTDNHLAIDARSRAAMAHTYLALTKDKQAEEQDRAIVLASLFRPITDGFVKDDAMPLISPASILSAQLEKR